MFDPSHADVRTLYAQQVSERGFHEDPAQLAAVAQLDELRDRLIAADQAEGSWPRRLLRRRHSKPPERGVYLWGGVGRGKTWLMDLFFHSLPFAAARRRHFHRFMHDVHTELKSLGRAQAPLETVADRLARETRVLCFDELFVTDIADAMILGGLFAGLFRRGVTLVATSNVPPRDLYKNGLQRPRFEPAIELLEEYTLVLAVDAGTDYRLRQLTQAGTYLPADARDTPQRLEALFAELSDGSGTRDGTIEIEGRPIEVVREADTAVWFTFEALCEGPRSQTDYIEIARDYQSVIVSGVPQLDGARDNAARRLISLVDELYDRNVKLILSAAAAPAGLYRGDRLRFEFQRTISRLTEMQSTDYLSRGHKP